MANCRSCGSRVALSAWHCPGCGSNLATLGMIVPKVLIVVVVLAVAAAVFS